MAKTELSQEQLQLIKRLLASSEWTICLDQWDKLSKRKEKEKADSLRVSDLDLAHRLQGILDGIEYARREIEALVVKKKEDNPSY